MSTRRSRGQNLERLHALRKDAVRLHLQGMRVMQIVDQTGLSWPSVRRAIDQYLAGGEAALVPAPRGKQSGDGRTLDAAQDSALRATISTQRPDRVGLDKGLWDREEVERLIERDTGSALSTRAVGNYLRRWGLALVRPQTRSTQGEPATVARWFADVYPTITARAKRDNAEIHWISVTPWVADDGEAATSQSSAPLCFGAASNQGKMRWMIAPDWSPSVGIEFLEALAADTGTRVIAIAEVGGPFADETFLALTEDASSGGRVTLIACPARTAAAAAHPGAPADSAEARLLDSPENEIIDAASTQRPSSNFHDSNGRSKDGRSLSRWLGSRLGPIDGPSRGNSMRFRSAAVAGIVLAVAASTAFFFASQPPKKINLKPMKGDFWAHRVAYPTMHFSPSWYTDAKVEDALVQSRVPAGERDELRAANSPLALSSESWTFLGPEPLLNGSYGVVAGRTNVIVVDPRGPDIDGLHTAYAASDGGGVFKTTNCCSADTTWRNVTDQPDIKSIAIGDLYIEPSNPDVIYAGTGDLRYSSFSYGTAGLLKSTDRGETWSVLGEEVFTPFYPPSASLGFPQYQAIGKVISDPNDADTLIVGTKTGLFVSNDGGVDWTGPCYTNPHASQRQDVTGLLARNVGGQTTLIAAIGTRGNPTPVQPDLANLGANGVYRATLPASGCPTTADWTLLNDGFPAGTGNGDPTGKVLGRLELAMSRTNPDVVYAMAAHATANNVLGVWRSDNGGTTWTQRAVTASIQSSGCASATGGGGQMWYDAGLAVDPNDPETVLLSGVDVYRSKDGGSTFQNVTCGYSNGNVHVDQHARAYLPAGPGNFDSDKVLAGGDGGVYYTANMSFGTGGTSAANRPSFISLNRTMGSIELYSGDITANFATSATPGASAGAQDNGSSWARWPSGTPGPAQWTVRNGGDGIYTRIEPVLENRWYYSSQNGNMVVSTGGPGSTPTAAAPNTGGLWGGDTLSFVMPFEIYRYGELDVAGSGCTSTLGCTYLIAGTTRVWETIQGAIPRTSWYANSPNLTKNTLGNRSFINQLAYAIKTPGVAIAGSNDGNVHYGHGLNQGIANSATWVDLTAGNAVLPNRPIMDVVIDVDDAANPAASAVGYAALGGFDQNTPAQPGHVYEVTCSNHCATFAWRNISRGLPNIPANAIAVNPNVPGQVFVGTDWGLYFTNDASAENPAWYRFDNGLPRVMIWDIAVDRGFTALAVYTRGRGVWAWPLPTTASDVIFANGFEPF